MSYDIQWLLDFLPRFNGISIINPTKWDFDDLCITTDTCLEPRGATCLNSCFTFEFPSHILRQSVHILALELFLVVVATQVWAVILHDHCFVISGSNETAVSAINFGKSLLSSFYAAMSSTALACRCHKWFRDSGTTRRRVSQYSLRLPRQMAHFFLIQEAVWGVVLTIRALLNSSVCGRAFFVFWHHLIVFLLPSIRSLQFARWVATTTTFIIFLQLAWQVLTLHFYECMAQLREGMSPRFLLWTPALEHISTMQRSLPVFAKNVPWKFGMPVLYVNL